MQKIRHKTLKVIYQSDAFYDDLLQLRNSVSLHQRRDTLLTEQAVFIDRNIQKYWYLESPVYVVMLQIQRGSIYNLRRGPVLFIPSARSIIYGTDSVHFRGSLIWNKLP